MTLYTKIFGDVSSKELKRIKPQVEKTNGFDVEIEKLSDEELKGKTEFFKNKIREASGAINENETDENGEIQKDIDMKKFRAEQEVLDGILPEAFAVVRESSKRVLKMRHFDTQLIGGAVLHRGEIAEMKTGEGKTLVSTLAIYLNALTGRGVHVVTVNDYLAKRDGEWMGKLYDFLGLSVGIIVHDKSFLVTFDQEKIKNQKSNLKNDESLRDDIKNTEGLELDKEIAQQVEIELENLIEVTRRQAYEADITYGTNNEYGFDYLRDNMVYELDQKSQRELHYAVIDEIDSILIDEARTPLIISAPAEESGAMYKQFASIVPQLEKETDYSVDEKMRAVSLTDDGIGKLEKILGMENIYDKGVELVHHLEQALKAQVLFARDKDYVVKEGEIIIVDEFTGRLMPGRRYSEGLHQAIEAKENVEIKKESVTLATITFQNYFRLYKKLSGMTGTAMTESEEFYKIYKLDVVAIPTNKKMVRKDLNDKIYKSEKEKFDALVEEIRLRNAVGQPVLVGTISIERNEVLAGLLKINGIPHEVLNAKQHEREASIIAQAGAKGAVTIATNMAGRGVDIILGGNPFDKEKADEVRGLGGLCVFGTERHESRRIDNQLRGRAGRQGDPGFSQFFISLEDELMRVFGGEKIKNIMERLGIPEGQPIENKMVSGSIEMAQKKVEGHNFDIRKHVLEYDDVMNKQRSSIYAKRAKILLGRDDDEGEEVSLIEKTRFVFAEVIENMVDFNISKNETLDLAKKAIWEGFTALVEKEKIGFEFEDFEKIENIDEVKKVLLGVVTDILDQMISEMSEAEVTNLIKYVYLRIIDMYWIQHLTEMDHLRAGIGLVGYGQKDPLVEYKHRSYNMFKQLQGMIDENFARTLLRIKVEKKNTEVSQASQTKETFENRGEIEEGKTEEIAKQNNQLLFSEKTGRNDPCPCGSGKKYKKCCGENK